MSRIQLIAIIASVAFLFFVGRLIIKGKLREEYAIIWIISTATLILFSFWRKGLEVIAGLMGVIEAPNVVFTAAIFAILIYILHISIVISKLQDNTKKLAQEIALLKNKASNAVPSKEFEIISNYKMEKEKGLNEVFLQ